ncbi:MAG: hypothetical protein LKJ63_03175 [Acetobacter fabarum]|jgi:hypothetical protein|nr:hypothetical protein [Acetobacter fabarum]
MFGRLAKFLLIASALAPVGLVYAWLAWCNKQHSIAMGIVAACAMLVLICVYLLRQARTSLERFPLNITSVEPADRENIAFMLLYLSPLFTSELGQININLLIPTLFIFTLLTATGYNYHFNPLLGLVGWHFYKVESTEGVTYVLITRKQLRNTSTINHVGQLTEYILIDLEDANAC